MEATIIGKFHFASLYLHRLSRIKFVPIFIYIRHTIVNFWSRSLNKYVHQLHLELTYRRLICFSVRLKCLPFNEYITYGNRCHFYWDEWWETKRTYIWDTHQKYFIWSIMLFDWYIVLILFPIFIEFDCQEWMRFAHKQAGVQIERFAHKHIYSSNGIEGNTKNYAKFFSIYFLMLNMYMMMVCILLSSDHLNAVLHVVKNSRLAHSNRQ